jgi:precorrin-3B C17-methyltransferase
MSGKLWVVGLGPGSSAQLTSEASDALHGADVLFGYGPYLDRVPVRAGQRRAASDNREEFDRANRALAEAAGGASVAVVSGGDPGVFAMAAAICEALERGPGCWRELEPACSPSPRAWALRWAMISARCLYPTI